MEVRHVATANYAFWSPLTGHPMPAGIKGPNGPEDLKSKADIIKFLKDSFALGHKAAATLTGENAAENVKTFQGEAPRLYLASFPVAHAFDHYGQMVEYLRMNGIVPPGKPQIVEFPNRGLGTKLGERPRFWVVLSAPSIVKNFQRFLASSWAG